MDWQPIETAPKGRVQILVCFMGRYITVCHYDLCDILVCSWDLEPYGRASHWMPLPEPPSDR